MTGSIFVCALVSHCNANNLVLEILKHDKIWELFTLASPAPNSAGDSSPRSSVIYARGRHSVRWQEGRDGGAVADAWSDTEEVWYDDHLLRGHDIFTQRLRHIRPVSPSDQAPVMNLSTPTHAVHLSTSVSQVIGLWHRLDVQALWKCQLCTYFNMFWQKCSLFVSVLW